MNKQRVLQALEFVKSNPYGKWGILNIEQRRFIKELCNSWLILDEATNMQTKEIERLNNIIEEQEKELELERKSRQLLTDDLANVCKMSLKKDNIIKEVRERLIKPSKFIERTERLKLLEILDKGE